MRTSSRGDALPCPQAPRLSPHRSLAPYCLRMPPHANEHTIIWVPVLVTQRNSAAFGLPRSAAMTRPTRAPIIPGVHPHPWDVEPVAIPGWADERWSDIRLRAEALQLSRPDAVVSHSSAAILHGWPLPNRLRTTDIHVTSPRTQVRRRGFRGHVAGRLEVLDHCRISVAGHYDTLRQLAGMMSARELIDVLDTMCGSWHGPALTTPDKLRTAAATWPRFRGRTALEYALRLVRAGVGSPQETALRLSIVDAGLPEPAVTSPVTLAGRTYRPDLSYPQLRIAIEYEGAHHLTHRRQWTSDITRERDFNDHGWVYIRVTADTDRGAFLMYLRQRLAERGGAGSGI